MRDVGLNVRVTGDDGRDTGDTNESEVLGMTSFSIGKIAFSLVK